MKLLALNTVNEYSQIGFKNGDIFENTELVSAHSEHLMPEIEKILIKNNCEVKELDYLGIVIGVGSFTGVRIGVAVVKGIMSVFETKCVCMNTFELVNYGVKDNNYIIMLSSGTMEPYFAEYKNAKLVKMDSKTETEIVDYANSKNLKIYIAEKESETFTDKNYVKVQILEDTIIKVMEQKIAQNEVTDINKIEPIYIKPSQAQKSLHDKVFANLVIKKVENATEILELENSCFENDKYSEQMLTDELNLQDRFYFVAQYNNKNIGYIGLWKTGDDLNLLKLCVVNAFRGIGVAHKLLEKSLEIKKEYNLDKYFLEVNENNLRAIDIYEKFGFVTKNKRKKYYKTGEDCLVMFYDKQN